ncbi:actin-binding LIM protein 1-like isoform X2 [Dysidea avara]
MCYACGDVCAGEVLKVQDRHFHINCFVCNVCQGSLAQGGYFLKDDKYYCKKDYEILFGIKCKACGQYVEGRVVTALGNTYHPRCFTCDRCRAQIQAGAVLTYDGKEVLCKMCAENLPHYISASSEKVGMQGSRSSSQPPPSPSTRHPDATLNDRLSPDGASNTLTKSEKPGSYSKDLRQTSLVIKSLDNHHSENKLDTNDFPDGSLTEMDVDHIVRSRLGTCAGCQKTIKSEQSYLALDRHWHIGCFVCNKCRTALSNEYIGKNDKPYCETCFHELFGVVCIACKQFIMGTVLEAGENHYHTKCAKCSKCHQNFVEGDEMCMSANTIWHLKCESNTVSQPQIEPIVKPARPPTVSSNGKLPTPVENRMRRKSTEPVTATSDNVVMMYPLKELQLIGKMKLPADVDRTKLERHLSDEEFYQVFNMAKEGFYKLAKWKQISLKKNAYLF